MKAWELGSGDLWRNMQDNNYLNLQKVIKLLYSTLRELLRRCIQETGEVTRRLAIGGLQKYLSLG